MNRTLVVSLITAATVAVAPAAIGLGVSEDSGSTAPGTGQVRASGDDAVDHVVVISTDGLNPDAVRQLGPEGAPAFYRMIRHGAATLNARSLHEVTKTLPNHTGMVTGRHVSGSGGHGVTFNADNGGTVHQSAGEHVSSMFTIVHDRGGHTAFYSTKDKFDFLDRSWDGAHGGSDQVGANDGRDKIDRYLYDDDAGLVTRLGDRLRRKPDELSFLHLALPDDAGHKHGFMSKKYVTAVRRTDRLVGQVIDTIAADNYLRGHTAILLTADHGGRGANHNNPASRANYTVPFMAWGATVARGADLYELNEDRRDPKAARTTYAGKQPIRNAEVANLATDLLDLPAVPGSQADRPRKLQVGPTG